MSSIKARVVTHTHITHPVIDGVPHHPRITAEVGDMAVTEDGRTRVLNPDTFAREYVHTGPDQWERR